MEKLTPDALRILRNEMTPEERANVRTKHQWASCLTAYLDSARPSLIRARLAEPRETFLTWMDGKTMDLVAATVVGGQSTPEALAEIFPMWEDDLAELPGAEEDEERDKERSLELTPQERKAILAELLPDLD